MGFLVYKRTPANGSVRYARLKPLKLGGRDGLIARHVHSLGSAETQSWKLDAAALLRLAGHDDAEHAVLFDVAGRDATSVCLYELSRIQGSCRDTSTQLALELLVLIDRGAGEDGGRVAQDFEVGGGAHSRHLNEILSLSGGPEGGDWKWGASALQIGATLVRAPLGGARGSSGTAGRKIAATAGDGL